MTEELNKKNWFRKHWVISIFLGIVVLGMIGSFFNSGNEDKSPTGNVVNEQGNKQEEVNTCVPNWNCGSWSECSSSRSQTRTCNDINDCGTNSGKPSETQSCTYQYGLEDRVVVGDLAYTLHSRTEKSEIGEYYGYGDYENFLGEKADGIFYIFDITIENVGKESITFWQTNVKIYDVAGRTFDPDTTAQIYLDDSFKFFARNLHVLTDR